METHSTDSSDAQLNVSETHPTGKMQYSSDAQRNASELPHNKPNSPDSEVQPTSQDNIELLSLGESRRSQRIAKPKHDRNYVYY